MNWISVRELLAIRRRVVTRFNGRPGLHNPAALYSSVRRPFTAFGGQAMFPSLLDKVAALVHCLIAFHPFKDGNEATALVAADVCLRLNGRRLLASDAVGEYFRSIAAGGQEPGEIAAWLAQHTEPWGEG